MLGKRRGKWLKRQKLGRGGQIIAPVSFRGLPSDAADIRGLCGRKTEAGKLLGKDRKRTKRRKLGRWVSFSASAFPLIRTEAAPSGKFDPAVVPIKSQRAVIIFQNFPRLPGERLGKVAWRDTFPHFPESPHGRNGATWKMATSRWLVRGRDVSTCGNSHIRRANHITPAVLIETIAT